MGEIDFGEIQQVLDELLGQNVDFQQMAEQGAAGKSPISFQSLLNMAGNLFFQELLEQKELWIHILILAIAAAVLLHFAEVFQNKGVSRISFCMIYMMLFLLLISSFRGSLEIAEGVLESMRNFMTVLAPAYFLAMTLTAYISSAGIYYEFTLFLISGVRWLTSVCLLPCIEIYILLVLVNHLSGEKRLGRLAELLSMLVGWSLKAVLAAVCGFHMVQGLISPAADAFRAMSVSRGIEAIPGVGDAGSSATDLVLGSAMLIKNGIGVAALVVLILLCMVPLVKLAVIMLVYYVLAAILQPVSDERITECLMGVGNGVKLLFQAVFTVLALFLLTIALTTAVTGR